MPLKNGRTTAALQAIVVGNTIPAGVIQAFGGGTVPTGWLLCDGSVVSRTTYAGLFAAISDKNGNGDGSTTFHLPDLRGRFVRGADDMGTGAAGRDPDAAGRTASNAGGATGNAVGSVQDDLSNSLSFIDVSSIGSSSAGTTRSIPYSGASGTVNTGTSGGAQFYRASFTNTGAESRPLNSNANYIIKV
jgi:microcystin-dependent protein